MLIQIFTLRNTRNIISKVIIDEASFPWLAAFLNSIIVNS